MAKLALSKTPLCVKLQGVLNLGSPFRCIAGRRYDARLLWMGLDRLYGLTEREIGVVEGLDR